MTGPSRPDSDPLVAALAKLLLVAAAARLQAPMPDGAADPEPAVDVPRPNPVRRRRPRATSERTSL
jgi:hypothetical protein